MFRSFFEKLGNENEKVEVKAISLGFNLQELETLNIKKNKLLL